MNVQHLPNEILLEILEFAYDQRVDVQNLSSLSSKFYQVCSKHSSWKTTKVECFQSLNDHQVVNVESQPLISDEESKFYASDDLQRLERMLIGTPKRTFLLDRVDYFGWLSPTYFASKFTYESS